VDLDGGGSHTLFLKNDGTVWSCGWNAGGSLGDGTNIDHSNPLPINNLSNITAISAGRINSLFLKSDSSVWACGYNWYGSLGDGTTNIQSIPVQLSSLSSIIAISAGGMPTIGDFSLFLKKDGTVWASGYNGNGALGDGTLTERHTPVQVNNVSGIVAISAGSGHSLFLKNDSTVWVCGYNGSGQLGIGTTSDVNIPVQIPSLSSVIAISAGYYHSLFLKSDGTVWACGSNFSGQLCNGTTAMSMVPIQTNSLTGVIAISAGQYHSLFLKNNSTVWACGSNNDGQLGVGSFDTNPHPNAIQITGLCSIQDINENHYENSISIFPNPITTHCVINSEYSLDDAMLYLYNLNGQNVKQLKNISGSSIILNCEDLDSGMYFLHIQENGKINIVKKIVIID
jgi:alpha-tubulin suppressor-like RCC1 family protein